LCATLAAAPVFVFDFYGTLVEDDVAVPPMWQELVRLGYRSSPALQAMFEPDGFDGIATPDLRCTPTHEEWNRANWRQLVRLSGVPADAVEAVLRQLLEGQARYRARAVPSALSLIDLLRCHARRIGLCSNWETPIEPHLAQAGLPKFDAISFSADVGARKPHLAIFKDICAKLGADPSDVVFVGDNWSSDVVGALRAGLSPVWIRGRHESRGLAHLVPEFRTLADFEACLARHLPRAARA